jgi:Skp family chaperone for outer membrane proteins
MTRKTEWPLITAVGGLLAALLVCMCLLAFPVYNNKTGQSELEVAKQDYQRQLQNLDRKYESKVNNLQEQLTALQFISNKKTDLLDDDVKGIKRDIDDVRERMKPRTK